MDRPTETDPTGDRPRMLSADREIWEVVRRDCFAGPAYNDLLDRICHHGLRAVDAAIRSGDMFRRANRQRRARLYAPKNWQDVDIQDVTSTVVAAAVERFTTLARDGRGWDPTVGALISAYFFSLCVNAFPNAFRSCRRRDAEEPDDAKATALVDPADHFDEVDVGLDFIRLTQDLPDRQRRAIRLLGQGRSRADIAKIMEESGRSVERLIRRARLTILAAKEAERDDR